MSNQTPTSVSFGTLSPEVPKSLALGLVVSLRVVLGWVLFYAGITEVLDPTWTAPGYLTNGVPETDPFTGVWTAMAGTPMVDVLVQWGLTLTGLGLIVGALVRWNAFWGSFVRLVFWASSLPLEHVVVDQHVVYVLILASVAVLGAGRVAGLDRILESTALVERHPRLRYLLG